MKLFALLLTAALLLAAGCAQNRKVGSGAAPSRLAELNDSNSGWSVPPGQTRVEDPDPAAAGKDGTGSNRKHPAIGENAPAGDASGNGQSNAGMGDSSRNPPPQKRVKPLVPAFPARIRQERISALRSVHFSFDSWDLSDEAKSVLDENSRWMKANPEVTIRIEGHTDERGTSEYNLALGERRARKVHAYLIFTGISAETLETVSFGEEMPVDPSSRNSAWSRNRRAEFSRVEQPKLSGLGTASPSG